MESKELLIKPACVVLIQMGNMSIQTMNKPVATYYNDYSMGCRSMGSIYTAYIQNILCEHDNKILTIDKYESNKKV